MSKLTAAKRKSLKVGDFALPGNKYPDEDESHAEDALARISEFGSQDEKETVRKKVKKKYPDMTVGGLSGGK